MGFRTVKPADDSLDSFRDYDRSPSKWVEHRGVCGCGVTTSMNCTVGPPGHPENGWWCSACWELRLRFQMEQERANAAHVVESAADQPLLLSQRSTPRRSVAGSSVLKD